MTLKELKAWIAALELAEPKAADRFCVNIWNSVEMEEPEGINTITIDRKSDEIYISW